jgi:hypothetical protein
MLDVKLANCPLSQLQTELVYYRNFSLIVKRF